MDIKDIKLDDRNFNLGTQKGRRLLNKSIDEFGTGRSILVDKNNVIIAGNKTFQAFKRTTNPELEIIETTGDELIAVKRNDIDINTDKGRGLAFADNHVAETNLCFDIDLAKDTLDKDTLNQWQFDYNEDTEHIDETQTTAGKYDIINIKFNKSSNKFRLALRAVLIKHKESILYNSMT